MHEFLKYSFGFYLFLATTTVNHNKINSYTPSLGFLVFGILLANKFTVSSATNTSSPITVIIIYT